MFICPNCKGRLLRAQGEYGVFWACAACNGRAIGLALLRRAITKDSINHLWQSAVQSGVQGRPCPVCRKFMAESSVSPDRKTPRLDVCRPCHFIWFDPREYEELAPAPLPAENPKPELPQRARELLARHQMELIRARYYDTLDTDAPRPAEVWKQVVGIIFRMPIEYEAPALRGVPWFTWGLAAAITLVSVLAFSTLEKTVQNFGFIPAQAWRYGGLTFLTSFFLHGGISHLAGNIYFLLIFGDNVEDYFGRRRYLLLLLLATVGGGILHIALDPRPEVPSIGASGGISGVIVLYALQFPKARLGGFEWVSLWFRTILSWIQMPAYLALILWILLQIFEASWQVWGVTHISALTHLGGAAVGCFCWLLWRKEAP